MLIPREFKCKFVFLFKHARRHIHIYPSSFIGCSPILLWTLDSAFKFIRLFYCAFVCLVNIRLELICIPYGSRQWTYLHLFVAQFILPLTIGLRNLCGDRWQPTARFLFDRSGVLQCDLFSSESRVVAWMQFSQFFTWLKICLASWLVPRLHCTYWSIIFLVSLIHHVRQNEVIIEV